jgi:hypothetical protein
MTTFPPFSTYFARIKLNSSLSLISEPVQVRTDLYFDNSVLSIEKFFKEGR